MWVIGSMENDMALENTHSLMENDILVIGRMVSEKDLDEGTLFPVIGMKDTGSVIKRTAPEFIITLTENQ